MRVNKLKASSIYLTGTATPGSPFGTAITSTNLGYVSSITAGTAAASKALVLGTSKEISQITTLGATTINCGTDTTHEKGKLYIWPDTVNKGSIYIHASDNSGDDVITITNGNTSGNITITLPTVTGTLLTDTNVTAGSSGSAGTINIYPATESKSYAKITSSDHDGNDDFPTLNFMAMSDAFTINLPDPGATAYVAYLAAEADQTLIASTPTEIDKYCDESAHAVVSATGATLAVTQATHANKIVVLNRAAGITCTLPEATGTGDKYTFVVGTAATSNSYIVKTADEANADMAGLATGVDQDTDATDDFPAIQADGFDVITLNRTTTGGVQPGYDKIVVTDIATDLWHARVHYSVPVGSNPATPFSST